MSINFEALEALANTLDTEQENTGLPSVDITQPQPLSFAQEQLWLFQQLNPDSAAYNLPRVFRMTGDIDADRLQQALNCLLERHSILRTQFTRFSEGNARQHIWPHLSLPLTQIDLRAQEASESLWPEKVQAAIATPFDLANPPLMRAQLIWLAPDQAIFCLVIHHILSDAWSNPILAKDLAQAYQALATIPDYRLPALPKHYVDFAVWQRETYGAPTKKTHQSPTEDLTYWQNYLRGEIPPLSFLPDSMADKKPVDNKPASDVRVLGRTTLTLPASLTAALAHTCSQQHTTPFALLLATWQLLMGRHTQQTDFVVGVPQLGRHHWELEAMVGYFVNPQPYRAHLTPNQTVADWLRSVQTDVSQALNHPQTPLACLQPWLPGERGDALFQSLFSYHNQATQATMHLDGMALETLDMPIAESRYEFKLEVEDLPSATTLHLDYNASAFEAARAQAMLEQFTNLLDQCLIQAFVSEGKPLTLGDISLVNWQQQQQCVAPTVPSRQTEPSVSGSTTLLDVVMAHAEQQPLALAITDGQASLTWSALLTHVSGFVSALQAQEVQAGDRIALALPRSMALPVAFLAAFHLGACAVVVDIKQPQARQDKILQDIQPKVVLTHSDEQVISPHLTHIPHLCATDIAPSHEPLPNRPAFDSGLPAYMTYTSGSTGTPKGVIITHTALNHYLAGVTQAVVRNNAGQTLRSMAMLSTPAADLGHTVLLGALHQGVSLHLLSGDIALDAAALAAYLRTHKVDCYKLVPGHLASLLKAASHTADQRALLPRQQLILGGEKVAPALINQLKQLSPTLNILNHYGPSETTVGVLTHPLEANRPSCWLGHPLVGNHCYLLDDRLNPVPAGVAGELYIGGAQLALGYWQRAAQTADRFIPHPLKAGERLYRTGDRMRYNSQGQWEFLGRTDDQVKIRGYRVEPAEIGAQLARLTDVIDATVLAFSQDQSQNQRQDQRHVLVAFLAFNHDDCTLTDVQARLASQVPEHLIPEVWHVLDKLPRTDNGKVDRRVLRDWHQAQTHTTDAAEQPTTALSPTQQQVMSVWQAVLQRASVGLHDHFVHLGGDSILSLQVVARLQKQGIRLPVKQVFETPTVAKLAAYIDSLPKNADAATHTHKVGAAPAFDTTAIPLTPIQARFFQQDMPERHHWNQSIVLALPESTDIARLDAAFQAVIRQHAALYQRYDETDAGWQSLPQTPDALSALWAASPLLWRYSVASVEEQDALSTQVQASLNLQEGRLIRLAVFGYPEGESQLLVVIHHLAVDGVSWRILLDDVEQYLTDATLSVGGDYRQWSQVQQDWSTSDALTAQMPYWQQQLTSDFRIPLIPDADTTTHNTWATAETLAIALTPAETQSLLTDINRNYRTDVTDVLLTALALSLRTWRQNSAPSHVALMLEGHGREETSQTPCDLSRTIGWFSSLYPVHLPIELHTDGQPDLGATLLAIKKTRLSCPDKGVGFGVLKYLTPQGATLLAGDLPQVTFNYLGQIQSNQSSASGFRWLDGHRGAERPNSAPLANVLGINSWVVNQQLQLEIRFSHRLLPASSVADFAQALQAQLGQIIAHCQAPNNAGCIAADFPLAALSDAQWQSLQADQALPPAHAIEAIFPTTPMQQGMLFHETLAQTSDLETPTYIGQLRTDILGLNVACFEAACQHVVNNEPLLRSSFVRHSQLAQPLHIIHCHCSVPFTLLDWRQSPNSKSASALDQLADTQRRQGFDTQTPGLFSLVVVRLTDERYHLIKTQHHLLLDGWSASLMMAAVLKRYEHLLANAASAKFEAPVPTADCITSAQTSRATESLAVYQAYLHWLQRQDSSAAKRFWQQQLAPLPHPTVLHSHWPAPKATRVHPTAVTTAKSTTTNPVQMCEWVQSFEVDITTQLMGFAKQHRVTLNTVLQAAWLILLHKVTGSHQLCCGATVSGRPAEVLGLQQQLGLFINTLPVVSQWRPEQSLADYVQALQHQNLTLQEYPQTPLSQIQQWAGQSGAPLFDHLLVFENYPVSSALAQGAGPLSFDAVEYQMSTSYPLTLAIHAKERIEVKYGFRTDLFSYSTIQALHAGWQHLLREFVAHRPVSNAQPHRIGQLSCLPDVDRANVFQHWQQPWGQYTERTVDQWIHEQALRRPQHTALICGDQSLRYGELENRANQLAHTLLARGVQPEACVGIYLHRSIHAFVAMLAVLKSGAAYLPLDPTYPSERTRYMLQDSGASLVLTQQTLRDQLPNNAIDTLCVDEPQTLSAQTTTTLPASVQRTPQQLAYVIYTSGSTGQPKGVAVEHRAISMHCQTIAQLYDMQADDVELQYASINFDGAHERWLTALMFGATLVARDRDVWDVARTVAEIQRHQITLATFTPSYLHQIADYAANNGITLPLRSCTVGGEGMTRASYEHIQQHLALPRIINGYGPTETVVTPTAQMLYPDTQFDTDYAPIGTVVGDRCAYVLDQTRQPILVGAVGELYLGGVGVARGYYGKPSASAEKFIPNPFLGDGSRLYATGDLVRLMPDGALEFIGRVDHQVKIRGFRIELGEITSQLLALDSVQAAEVIAQETPHGKQLVAYCVPSVSLKAAESLEIKETQGTESLPATIKRQLTTCLPDYMVPSQIVALDCLPLTPAGKVDRQALPTPERSQSTFVPPETPLQAQLATLWQAVLHRESIGLDDHFFDVGGHSLTAMQLQLKIQAHLSVNLSITDLMAAPTLRQQAERVQALSTPCDLPDDSLDEMAALLDELDG